MLFSTQFKSQKLHNCPELVIKFLYRFASAILVYVTSGLLVGVGPTLEGNNFGYSNTLGALQSRTKQELCQFYIFGSLTYAYQRVRTREEVPQDHSISPEKSCQDSPGIAVTPQEPIEIDQYIHFLSDMSKHMAFSHSDWLETN